MYVPSAGDRLEGSRVQSGSLASTDANTSDTSSPANARVPVSIS